ncbi:MAG: 2-oxo acid dehydrogenase subunit E2 [Chloroflexi bacterium]|nr:2-oxo acid dehydrogenase subunit E2 [Chloroflexota bacterium]
MATELTMPQMGFDMHEGTLVRWLKPEGATVQNGEAIAEIETDKAVVEFESYASGVLSKILVSEGTTVPVGQVIAIVGAEGEVVADVAPPRTPIAASAPPESAVAPTVVEVRSSGSGNGSAPPPEVRASPVARKLAQERGIDLAQLVGTGPGGRITKDDVLGAQVAPVTAAAGPAAVAPAAAPAQGGELMPLSRMRQQIARVTVRSKQEKPHFYVSSEIDMTAAMDLRRDINETLEADGVRVTVNDLIIKACVEALRRHPKFNAILEGDGIRFNEAINVGVAIAEEEGLIVPAIMDCAGKSLRDIAVASKDLADRARNGTLHPQEYTGGTFAISNLGMFDVSSFIAIIHPPQTAVLAVGTVAKKPVVRGDEIAVAQMMTATLSADHRVVDGAEGAEFIVDVKRLLESPLSLML